MRTIFGGDDVHDSTAAGSFYSAESHEDGAIGSICAPVPEYPVEEVDASRGRNSLPLQGIKRRWMNGTPRPYQLNYPDDDFRTRDCFQSN